MFYLYCSFKRQTISIERVKLDFIFCGVNKQTWQVSLTPAKVFLWLNEFSMK